MLSLCIPRWPGSHLAWAEPSVWWGLAPAPGFCPLACDNGEVCAFDFVLADPWAWVLELSMSLQGTVTRTYPGNGLAVPCPWVLCGWTQATSNSVTLADVFVSQSWHLALQSCTQRVMPGILPSATRNECSPRAYCQVMLAGCSLGAKWPLGECVGLSPGNTGTEHSEDNADCCMRLCILTQPSVWKLSCLRAAFASLCNCGDWEGVRWIEAVGFTALPVCSKILVGSHAAWVDSGWTQKSEVT